MEKILVLLSTEQNGELGKHARETIGAAKSLSHEFVLGVVGDLSEKAMKDLSQAGADHMLIVAGGDFNMSRYASDAYAGEQIVRASGAVLVLAPANSRWSRALPGICHRLEGRMDPQVTALSQKDGAIYVTRWFYRQRIEAVLTRKCRPWFITISAGSFPVWEGKGSEVKTSVERLNLTLPDTMKKSNVLSIKEPPTNQQTIKPDSPLLFVAGAGWTKKQADGAVHQEEAEKLIFGFLDASKASLGGTKSVVDLAGEGQKSLSLMSHLHQVGQTGSTPRHKKGIATCCHGEEPHVVGWRFINERRAINLDPNCSWAHGKTDVLYVADAFQLVKKVNELLSR